MNERNGGPGSGLRSWDRLTRSIEERSASVGVVGLGYVGLPLAVAFADAGFAVTGLDTDPGRVVPVNDGRSHVHDVTDADLLRLVAAGRLRATSSYDDLRDADVVIICVPTPLMEGRPDLSAIQAAGAGVAGILTQGTLVVLESTTYPGTTEELLQPLLESTGLRLGRDFLLAFSPERIDPGNPQFAFTDIPKVVGGADAASTTVAEIFYSQVVPKVITVSGTREAEMSKLVENTFRHVNIALVNELATHAHDWGIDIWETIEAAASKPFGFMPFWPGPGWGGHCIPLDPSYLSWRVRRDRYHEMRFVELAQSINNEMLGHVVERIGLMLNERSKSVRDARILLVGAAYKPGTDDTRGSAAINVLTALEKRGAKVVYHDPLVPELTVTGRTHRSVALTRAAVRRQDLVVVLIRQKAVDWDLIHATAARIFDCCNALGFPNGKVTRL